MTQVEALIGGTDSVVILVPHPDDEVIGCGILLNRLQKRGINVHLVFMTLGLPCENRMSETAKGRYGSHQEYRELRLSESNSVVNNIEIESLTRFPFFSRELHNHLPKAESLVREQIRIDSSPLILVPAYEGAHPDHDATHLIGRRIAIETGLAVIEYAGYNIQDGMKTFQKFIPDRERHEWHLSPTATEIDWKRTLLSQYQSQASILNNFTPEIETFRIPPDYDYSKPAPCGLPFYETWNSGIAASPIYEKFIEYVKK